MLQLFQSKYNVNIFLINLVNYLCFQDDSSDGCLADIGSVKTVHTVDPEHASLFTDCIVPAQPYQRKGNNKYEISKYSSLFIKHTQKVVNTVYMDTGIY